MDYDYWWMVGWKGAGVYAFGHYYDNGEAALWMRDCRTRSEFNQGIIDYDIHVDGWSRGRFYKSDCTIVNGLS